VLLRSRPGEPPVGRQLIEAGHHLLLAHHRQAGQIGGLETPRVDARQAPGMKRGALDRAGQQRAQPLALVGGQPFGVPGQALHVVWQPGGERLAVARAERVQAGIGGRGHVGLLAPFGQSPGGAGGSAKRRSRSNAAESAELPGSAACSRRMPASTVRISCAI
jgi:hypothetical protein